MVNGRCSAVTPRDSIEPARASWRAFLARSVTHFFASPLAQDSYRIMIALASFTPRETHACDVAKRGRVRGRDRRVMRRLVARLRADGWTVPRGRFG